MKVALLLSGVLVVGALASVGARAAGTRFGDAAVGPSVGGCDPIDPPRCLLPFPDDYFTVPDASSPTGRRVAFSPEVMPANAEGKPVDPTAWNQSDGFSPGTPILAFVPGVDLNQTWGTTSYPRARRDSLADLSRSLLPASPVVLVDALTGTRQALWSELDRRPGVPDDARVLIIHPARGLSLGHHYVIGLRNLRAGDGSIIPANAAFAAYRDGLATDDRLEHDFAILGEAGVKRDSLYLAWDFTIASEANITGRAVHIRDDAFHSLGAGDLTRGRIEGLPPSFTVTSVQDFTPDEQPTTARRVRGTVDVPNYLTPQVEGDGTAVPGTRFFSLDDSGMPTRDLAQPDLQVPWVCDIPPTAFAAPSPLLLYGHGLLGSEEEVNGPSADELRRQGFTTCATDWLGMSSADIDGFKAALLDLSNFPSIPDRSQQGFLGFMFLGRLLAHPSGAVTDAAFRTAAGRPLIQTGTLSFAGNSQGAILGGALTALEPDVPRAVLGVPAMDFSMVLDRSIDWYGGLDNIYKSAYPDPVVQEIGFGLMQMLWDRAESDGYAQNMTMNPLPGSPRHQVLLQVAYGDHQVSNIVTEVEGRTVGALLKEPSLPPRAHWAVNPAFGFATVSHLPASGGSYLVYWFDPTAGDGVPPLVNFPDTTGRDSHDYPRLDRNAMEQAAIFLLTGSLVDTCNGAPCLTLPSTRTS